MVQSTKVQIDICRKFQRTRPLALEPHISQYEWESLADDVDRIVLKQGKALKPFKRLICCGRLLGIALLLCGLLFFSSEGDTSGVPIVIAGPLLVIACSILSYICMFRINSEWKEEMKIVAEDISKKFRDVTIHFDEEKIPYIRGGHGNVRRGYTTSYFYEISYKDDLEAATATMVTVNNTSAKERLNELENLKDVISPEEYDEKRKEILSAI